MHRKHPVTRVDAGGLCVRDSRLCRRQRLRCAPCLADRSSDGLNQRSPRWCASSAGYDDQRQVRGGTRKRARVPKCTGGGPGPVRRRESPRARRAAGRGDARPGLSAPGPAGCGGEMCASPRAQRPSLSDALGCGRSGHSLGTARPVLERAGVPLLCCLSLARCRSVGTVRARAGPWALTGQSRCGRAASYQTSSHARERKDRCRETRLWLQMLQPSVLAMSRCWRRRGWFSTSPWTAPSRRTARGEAAVRRNPSNSSRFVVDVSFGSN
jgi:hypothetical protein